VDGEIVVARRRQWTAEEKAALMAEVEAEVGQVSVVAQRHGISKSLLYNWRSAWKAAGLAARARAVRPTEFVQLGIVADASGQDPMMPITTGAVPPRGSGFPYDAGDDPAFFSALYYDGPVTWGVCRPNVRCPIRKNDGVVFFAEQKDSQDNSNYRFVAALRVADKIEHTALSMHPLFSQYFNLVIRPCGAGWEHHESGLCRRHTLIGSGRLHASH
jgi:hypothetical protein